MGIYPKNHDKESFIKFLEKNNVNIEIINRIRNLPPTVMAESGEFKLNIVSTYYSANGSYYNFELNYYSEELMEFLFTYKIFQDIEVSLNYLECELKRNKYIVEANCD